MSAPTLPDGTFDVETFADRAAWIVGRTGIGGSDAPAIWSCGFRRPYALWAEKRGLAPPVDETEAMEAGTLVEPVIAELYHRRTGRTLIDPGRTTILRSTRWPWMFVSVDRVINALAAPPQFARAGWGVLECKNKDASKGWEWDGTAPDDVQVQVQHALAVTGWTWGSAAALVGGNRLRWVDIERNETFIEEHVEQCRIMVERIESGEPPEITDHASDERAVKALHPDDNGETVAIDEATARWAVALELAREAKSDAETAERLAQNKLRAAIGSSTCARLPDGTIYTCKTTERAGYTVESTTYRALTKQRAKRGSRP